MQDEDKNDLRNDTELVSSSSNIGNSNCCCTCNNDIEYPLANNSTTLHQNSQHHHQQNNSVTAVSRILNHNIPHNHNSSNFYMPRLSKCQQLNATSLTQCDDLDLFCGCNTNSNETDNNQNHQFPCTSGSSDNSYTQLKSENSQMLQSQNNCKTFNAPFGRYQVIFKNFYFYFKVLFLEYIKNNSY